MHDSTAARVGALFQLLVQDTTAQDFGLPSSAIQHPLPIDMNTLTALKRCSLGLDLYLWLVYRTFPLRAPLRLTWRQLYQQFGSDPDRARDKRTVLNFRSQALRELKKIKLAWPGLNYSIAPGVLILYPSTPTIAPLNQDQLAS